MSRYRGLLFSVVSSLAFISAFSSPVSAQVSAHAETLVTKAVDESDLITRSGNVHPAVSVANDLGRMSDDRAFEHLLLQMTRSPEQQAARDQFLEDLHNPKSANFHKWLSSAEYGQRFGLAESDIGAVEEWLESHGFTVNAVYPNLAIDFSGTAGEVREAFHTEIHKLELNGERHFANISNPQIPAALAGVVAGPVALHDFKPRPGVRALSPAYTVNTPRGPHLVAPADLETIYNMNPVYSAGISGQGQTVVLLERTDLYASGDWSYFRKVLGLERKFPKGNLQIVHPQPNASNANNGGPCADPGVNGNDLEAVIDVEWASASAPNATIELASCADTDTNSGFFIAMQNLITQSTPPPAIMSLSYEASESENGAALNLYVAELYALAESEHVSLFVAAGDAGADTTDQFSHAATHGINVNGLASTPYDVAVGGTDYGDSYLNEVRTYWNSTNDPRTFGSAKSYIPEIPWNDSCAGQLLALSYGFSTTYGAGGFCNDPTNGEKQFLVVEGGSGGPSACAYGDPNREGVVGGTCSGYPKPSYQTLSAGNPNDGVRDLPDVAMFAATGVWGHYFVICYSDPAGGGVPCTRDPANWSGGGGTSFGAPIFAGIQALINQATASAQGNPNFLYYSLDNSEALSPGLAACDSTLGNAVGSNCVWHDVTLGDMDVNCLPLTNKKGQVVGTFNCYYPDRRPGVNGVLSLSNTAYEPAYPAIQGWDFATGIGTPNVAKLVANWPGSITSTAVKK